MNRAPFFAILRKIKVLYYLDFIRFFSQKVSRLQKNRSFKKEYPEVKLPPDYLIYESFHLDYKKYYLDGYDTAKWLVGLLKSKTNLKFTKILDWGCGPGRIIRHLPLILNESCSIYGTDYNEHSIKWCSENIENVSFHHNNITPPLYFEDNYFDIIYGISIFTHLSEKSHHEWIKELIRVLKNDGIILVTTHGNAFREILSSNELTKFNAGELVIRDKVKEGHKIFGAFHPPKFMHNFFSEYIEVIDFIPGEKSNNNKQEHDIWILKNSMLDK